MQAAEAVRAAQRHRNKEALLIEKQQEILQDAGKRNNMQNNDWIKTGEDILHSVLDAVEQQDFSGLSRSIEEKVTGALDSTRNTTQEWLHTRKEKERAEQQKKAEESRQLQLYQKNPPGTYSGTTFQVLGIVGTSLFGISTMVITLLAGATGLFGLWIADTILGCLTAGSVIMLSCGVRIKSKVRRFRNYVKLVGDKQYCKIEELARAVGKSTRFVKNELSRMINDNFFLQGHLDHGKTTLITSNEMYDRYLEAENSRMNRELEAAKQVSLQANAGDYPEEVQQILAQGNGYIQHIRECNDAIPGEVMSGKLEKLENIMGRIFEQLKKNPESCEDLQKLMKYYLPTTTKLLDAYIELDAQPAYGSKNIEVTKKEIEDTLDVINEAFGRLFDDMFEETAWDISADISTMKTMLAKEGLTGERDFQI